MYAVIETGGKQYRVSQGQVVDVELLAADKGDQVALDRVLLISDGDQVQVGRPLVSGAVVRATVMGHVRGAKVIIFEYRPKKRFRQKNGHRQHYTRLRIDEISA